MTASLSDKFYAEYSKAQQDLAFDLIPEEQKYQQILSFLYNGGIIPDGDKKEMQMKRRWKQRYCIKQINGVFQLYRGQKQVVYVEQLFDLLHKAHVEDVGHGGRDAMRHYFRNFHGIGRRIICMYLKLCEYCELKRAGVVKRSILVKPIMMEQDSSNTEAQYGREMLTEEGGIGLTGANNANITAFQKITALWNGIDDEEYKLKKIKKLKRASAETPIGRPTNKVMGEMVSTTDINKEQSECDAFCFMVGKKMAKLDEDEREEVQLRIMQLFAEIRNRRRARHELGAWNQQGGGGGGGQQQNLT